MSAEPSSDDIAVWNRLVESHNAFAMASREFLAEGVDRVRLMHSALRGKDRATAIYMLRHLRVSELQQLFDDLVFQASYAHGAIGAIREAILSLPREWVLGNIEQVAEPLLQDGTYDEYRRLLELCIELDRDLTYRLARRAVEQTDEDIREAGKDFLDRLSLTRKIEYQDEAHNDQG